MAEQDRTRVEHYYILFRSAFSKLAAHSLEKDQLRYHLRPKVHHLEHLIYDHACHGRNWRYHACYLGEDMVRRIKRMACKTHPSVTGLRVLEHYALFVCLTWAGLLDDDIDD